MNMEKKPIRLAGKTMRHSPHVCAFFNSRDEEYRVLLPFIKEGFEEGDKAFHIIDPRYRQDHMERLQRAGINVDETQAKGQLEVRDWGNAYLREDNFNQDKMIDLLEEVLNETHTLGYALTRLVAHMEWSLTDYPGVQDLIEYESRLNYMLPKYEDPVICTYDISKFSAATLMDILRVHPMAIIGGILHENPFYTPPDQFLQELHQRHEVV